MKNLSLYLLACIGLLASCSPNNKKENDQASTQAALPYDLSQPTEKYKMPHHLEEISGLSYYKGKQLACINDEKGVVYFYDYQQKNVANEVKFGKTGDYEGVEVVEDEIFVLQSNGIINTFKIEEPYERKIDCSSPDVKEYEGLSYDPQRQMLLLAAKQRIKDRDDVKMIYGYSLPNKSLFKYMGIPESQVADESGNKVFMPSGIAVNPENRDVYILAAQGHKLLVVAKGGIKKALIKLDPSIFKQPEGICFAPDGTLFIASEGDGKAGYILRFQKKSE